MSGGSQLRVASRHCCSNAVCSCFCKADVTRCSSKAAVLACCQVVVLSSSGRTAARAQTAAEADLAQSACFRVYGFRGFRFFLGFF